MLIITATKVEFLLSERGVRPCLPLRFTPRLAANIAGQVFVIRFVAP